MNADNNLAQAVSDWQRKYRIADDDPMIATLVLVRIYLREAYMSDKQPETVPPTFDDFRDTIELLDRCSRGLIHQATDLVAELRRFGQNVRRLNRTRFVTQLVLVAISLAVGALFAQWL